jgi:DNA-binding MarR family transcriptional regulator
MADPEHPFCTCLCYAANALARTITRLSDDAFARTGLAPSLGYVLMTVQRKPGIQPSEVAEITMLDPSTVTRLVEKLQAKGLVRRETQGRTALIHPTPAGLALVPDLLAAWDQVFQTCAERLGPEPTRALAAQLYEAARCLDGLPPPGPA